MNLKSKSIARALVFIVAIIGAAGTNSQDVGDFSEPDLSGSDYDISANPFAEKSGNQCTWYVYGRVREKQSVDLVFTEQTIRHAYRWNDIIDTSYRRGQEPLAGSIAVWAPRKAGGNRGHVAYVEYVDGDVVYYTEANFSTFDKGGGYDGYLKHTPRGTFEGDKGLTGAYRFVTYIYPSDGLELVGKWHSEQYGYGFELSGKVGNATLSNSSAFAVGDIILKIDKISGVRFTGAQMFTDGRWYSVSGELEDSETLQLIGGGYSWQMRRVNSVP